MTAQISAVVAIIAALISCLQLLVNRATSRGGILSNAMNNHWSDDNVALRDAVYRLEDKRIRPVVGGGAGCGHYSRHTDLTNWFPSPEFLRRPSGVPRLLVTVVPEALRHTVADDRRPACTPEGSRPVDLLRVASAEGLPTYFA